MQKLLLVCYHSENRATSQIWKVLPNMVFPPIWGEKMAAFWACACKLSWTLLSPAWVQLLYGAGRKESSGTGLVLCTIWPHGTEKITLGRKLRSGTFKTKKGKAGLVRVPLFWKSHCVICVPVLFIPYHVTGSCKGPIGKKKPKEIRATTGFEPVTSAIPVRCKYLVHVSCNQESLYSSHISMFWAVL